MKRRCVPLRGDHNLLTPDTHTLSGVRLHPVVQVRLEGVASHPGHLVDSSSSKSTVGLTRRRPIASPTRRLRFEDETETEAESRYLERQRQRTWMGQQGTSVLVSKPDLSVYINSKVEAAPQGTGHDPDRQLRGRTSTGGVGLAAQCDTYGTVLGGGVNLNPPDGRGWSLHQPHINLRTEPIRETYIGSVTPGETTHPCRGGVARRVSNTQVRRSINQVDKTQVQATTDLPINPYSPDLATMPSLRCPLPLSPPPVTLSVMSQGIMLNCTKAGQVLNQNQEEQGKPAAAKSHRELQAHAELRAMSPCMEEAGGVDLKKNSCSSSSFSSFSERSSDTTAASRAPPISESSKDKQVKDPIRGELRRDDSSLPEHFSSRDESSRLSLRRLFSTVRLNRTRTGSLDRLSHRPRPSTYDPAPSSLMKTCLSTQSLNEQGSPFSQLRKLSLGQRFGSEQKTDRSSDYMPAADRFLRRSLSVEDISGPCS